MRNGIMRSLRLLTVFASLAANSAWAADSGFYFGFNAGASDFDSGIGTVAVADVILVPGPIITAGPIFTQFPGGGVFALQETTRSDVDQRDVTFSASVGYTFNRFVSLELSYADLGELTRSQVTTFQSNNPDVIIITPTSIRSTQELSAETLSISVLGSLPLSERWSLFGRAGYGYSESEVEFRTAFSVPGAQSFQFEQDFDSEDYVLGAGVGFKLSTRWTLRADYERIFEAAAESVDVDRFGLSAIYRL